ncbi:hypothetical protein [Thermococcus sp. MAR1]|uniref:hypothetical protein n=1 Tax=Thermococcus sp. MAR1 TaxID=1638263 RepID=UPI00143A9DD6|nr:hypothetical protein [Thermococcus sp. MAR1]NJE11232.1 hypothetical protein [Thermococcus sp. MAR1]
MKSLRDKYTEEFIMWIKGTGSLPVRGIPLFLFSSGLIGISTSWHISRLTGDYLQLVFVFFWVFSNSFGVKVEEGKSYLVSSGMGEGFLKLIKGAMKNASTS